MVSTKPITANKHSSAVQVGTIVSKSVTNLRNIPSKQTQNLERQKRIEVAASYRAEQRGISSGYEVQDWLKAEAEIDTTSQL